MKNSLATVGQLISDLAFVTNDNPNAHFSDLNLHLKETSIRKTDLKTTS